MIQEPRYFKSSYFLNLAVVYSFYFSFSWYGIRTGNSFGFIQIKPDKCSYFLEICSEILPILQKVCQQGDYYKENWDEQGV